MKNAHDKVLNMAKGGTSKDKKGVKAKLPYKFMKDQGAKNNDTQED